MTRCARCPAHDAQLGMMTVGDEIPFDGVVARLVAGIYPGGYGRPARRILDGEHPGRMRMFSVADQRSIPE